MLTISAHLSHFSDFLTTSVHYTSHANSTCMQKQEQPPSKRKAASEMDGNPLANAAKRTKKDAKNASKRKLLANAEPTRSGLFIVRESSFSQPESNSRESSAAQQPSSSLPLKRNASSDLPQPPSKKARAESQPPSTLKTKSTAPRPSPAQQPRQTHRSGSLPPANGRLAPHHTNGFASIAEEDERIEDDVRAMDAEADRLRRSSRVYLPESSSSTSTSIITFNPGQERPRARSRSRGRVISMDTVQAVPVDESPQIERNKRLREGAMNAIAATNGDASHAETSRRGREREREPSTVNGHHRRKSSLSGRGKRISTSFEVGVIPQPHNSVSDASFYKHIDADLPDAERLRTLLIWCASRAAAKPSAPLSKPNSGASDNGKGKDNPPPAPDLPPLSARAQEFLKNTQEDVIRMLAERRIDLSLFSGDDPLPSRGEVPLKPNEQNVTNRILEVRYAQQIKRYVHGVSLLVWFLRVP
ncbi:hypothetical protein AX14_014458 [Amanita brunnescens Koide BX004]|nr:hypothetical protein AX14_014458 [Amanita brunnescens Koide BX004]